MAFMFAICLCAMAVNPELRCATVFDEDLTGKGMSVQMMITHGYIYNCVEGKGNPEFVNKIFNLIQHDKGRADTFTSRYSVENGVPVVYVYMQIKDNGKLIKVNLVSEKNGEFRFFIHEPK